MIHEVIKESFIQEAPYPAKNSFFISFLIMILRRHPFRRKSQIPYLSGKGCERHLNSIITRLLICQKLIRK